MSDKGKFDVISDEEAEARERNCLEPLPLEQPPEIDPMPEEVLNPRHRKMAHLVASGKKNIEVAELMNCTPQTVSNVRQHRNFQIEVTRIQNRLYEDTTEKRIKELRGDALEVIEAALRDTKNKYKSGEKLAAANWILEQISGKSVQKHEVTGSVLVSVLDKLDSLKESGKSVAELPEPPEREVIDVTEAPETEEEKLKRRWDVEF